MIDTFSGLLPLAQLPGAPAPDAIDLGEGFRWLGIEWIGINPENGQKLAVTLIFVVVVSLIAWALSKLTTWALWPPSPATATMRRI